MTAHVGQALALLEQLDADLRDAAPEHFTSALDLGSIA